jgi:hypothetical protein
MALMAKTMSREEEQDMLAEMDSLVAARPPYFAGAIQGMLLGLAVGFVLDNKRAGGGGYRRIAKYAAIGAGLNMASQMVVHAALGGAVHYMEAHPLNPPPATPIVTKGAFAGAPRPLYPVRS